jgi:hypothetical protein
VALDKASLFKAGWPGAKIAVSCYAPKPGWLNARKLARQKSRQSTALSLGDADPDHAEQIGASPAVLPIAPAFLNRPASIRTPFRGARPIPKPLAALISHFGRFSRILRDHLADTSPTRDDRSCARSKPSASSSRIPVTSINCSPEAALEHEAEATDSDLPEPSLGDGDPDYADIDQCFPGNQGTRFLYGAENN